MDATYRVARYRNGGGREITLVAGISSLLEAAEIALRLTRLQEDELGGTDEFCACPE